jgi:magnesium-transporting ATPase (P-type)
MSGEWLSKRGGFQASGSVAAIQDYVTRASGHLMNIIAGLDIAHGEWQLRSSPLLVYTWGRPNPFQPALFMEYYLTSVANVATALTTTPAGLDTATAAWRLAEHGPNQLADTQQKSLWQLVVHQLAEVMILVLLAAAGVSVRIGEAKSAYVIPAIVVLNGS